MSGRCVAVFALFNTLLLIGDGGSSMTIGGEMVLTLRLKR